MTNVLLLIIIVLLFARIVLMVNQGRRACGKSYATTSDVENIMVRCEDHVDNIHPILKEKGDSGYEFSQAVAYGGYVFLFFTKKKIKSYYEKDF